jgi:hemerythrin-like metal-binding protein
VGNKELDSQHKMLLGLVNDLYADMYQGPADHQAMAGLLDRLVRYTHTHFAREEELMRARHFPDYAAHKVIHDLMKIKTAQLRQDWESVNRAEVLKFLKNWFVDHICGTDKQYAPFLAEQPCNA